MDNVARKLVARLGILALAALVIGVLERPSPVHAESPGVARSADGRPDLSGHYDAATLTPIERPKEYGDNLYLTPDQAAAIVRKEQRRVERLAQPSDPNRAPPATGGQVGAYNDFWGDRGTTVTSIDDRFRSSILTHPVYGRIPELTPEARAAVNEGLLEGGPKTSTKSWVVQRARDSFDDPERSPLTDRCLIGFGSTAGPPMLPVTYNNIKRIVQTRDHVVILAEMVHDARIVRIDGQHAPSEARRWLGDSIGHWEGDVLVVDTTNFTRRPALPLASENLHVVERFQRLSDGDLKYTFTVEDPTIWTQSWSGEYRWRATGEKVYEYACHEGNYAMGSILRGARRMEADGLVPGETEAPEPE